MTPEKPFWSKSFKDPDTGDSVFGEKDPKELELTQEAPEGMEEVMIDGEKVLCRRIDMLKEYGDALKTAEQYRKIVKVKARQATEREEIRTTQDGDVTVNVAMPGDWIVQNPGDESPYVFGDKFVKDESGAEVPTTVEERNAAFAKKYDAIDSEPNTFQSKGVIRAMRVNEDIVFNTSFGEMSVKAGGWVSDGNYSIREDSFANTYEKVA